MGTPTIPNIRSMPLVENQQITVWWDPPSSGNPLNYQLVLNPGVITVTIPGTWQEYTFNGLVNGTQYSISIAATNDGSTYGPSANFVVVIPDGPPLNPPQNAIASVSGSNTVTLTWSLPSIPPLSPFTSYIITATSTDSNISTVTITQPASLGRTALLSGLDSSSIYTFTIQGVNDIGVSPGATTNPIAFTQSYGIPDWAVSNFANSDVGGNNFRNFHCGIACDTQNNVYIVGQCSQSTLNLFNYHSTLGNGTISTTIAGIFVSTGLAYTTGFFTYVVKYTSSGQVAWFAPTLNGANNSARPSGISTDRGNNVYISYEIAGGYQYRLYNAQVPGPSGIISTGTEYGRFSAPPSFEMALVKYNSDGVIQWATWNGGGNDSQFSEQRNSIVTDSQNNVYSLFYSYNFTSTLLYSASGVTNGIIQISTVARFIGDGDAILAPNSILTKHDSNGQFQWAIKSPLNIQNNNFTLAIDSNDNIFLPTQLSTPSTVVFNYAGISSSVISTSIYGRILKDSTQAGLDGLVIKYNSNGQAQWVVQQNISAINTTIPPRTIATDIYGNLFTFHNIGTTSLPLTFHSFQSVTSDGYISTTASAVILNNHQYIAKYNSNGQFIACSAQMIPGSVTQNSSGTLMTDYSGNVYYVTNDSTGANLYWVMRDFYVFNSNTTPGPSTILLKEWGQTARPSFGLCTTIRKMDNNLQTQYAFSFSNFPFISTTSLLTSNICIDRNSYLYFAGTAQVSSLYDATVQSSIPMPQWAGVAGGPYSWRTTTNTPSFVSISSIVTSTTTYAFLMKYK